MMKRRLKKMNEEEYVIETKKHINMVYSILKKISDDLIIRGEKHDSSKFSKEEKEGFIEYTPKLKNCTYGSDEYKVYLKGLKKTLDHHYSNNRHHPEFFKNSLSGMNLFDIVEMISDWKAATLRHNDGDIYKSLEINKERFNISNELYLILKNTIEEINKYEIFENK
jgi:hypothetical protein